MPKIGMRIVKTAIAVFLCFLIDLLRNHQGVPFYSAIAAILCMQPFVSNSVKVALNRSVGTFIGGLFGMLVLLAERAWLPKGMPILQYFIVSLCVVALIYITVVLKKTSASYITCVVFLSVTISHGADVNPYLFAINRIIDTLIGIAVSLAVNAARLPRKKDRNTLFITGLDGVLWEKEKALSSFSRIRLTHLLNQGARITAVTDRSPASFLPLIGDIPFALPVIAMNGAALYHIPSNTYAYCKTIPRTITDRLQSFFAQREVNCFTKAVIHDVLHIYYGSFTNEAQEDLYRIRHGGPLENYVCAGLPEGHEAVCLMIIDTDAMVERLYEEIVASPFSSQLRLIRRADRTHPRYSILEIYSAEATLTGAAGILKSRSGADSITVFSNSDDELSLILHADYSYAVGNAAESVQESCRYKTGSGEQVIRTISRLFYCRRESQFSNKTRVKRKGHGREGTNCGSSH